MNRSVVVNLVANVSSWNRGLANAASTMQNVTQQNKRQVGELSTQVGMLGAAMVGFAGMAVKKFMDFDASMSAVKASTGETAENMDVLREAALKAGAATVYSATESAGAIEELGKAGMSTADIVGGALDGALSLAASEGMAVADAAEIAASAMTQFGLSGNKASHVADLLAAGAGKAQGSAHDLGMALNQSGLVANQFGMSIEDTTGTLAAFASAGMVGSDAGTSLRSMLLRLANPADETKEVMDELGVSAYNTGGKFIGVAALADQLAEATKHLTQQQRDQALAQIFGMDAIRGANILLKQGSEGIREWTDAVNEQGYAAKAAETRLDNLKGDIEALGGAIDTLFISMGEGGDGALRWLTQSLTGVVDGFNSLPDPIKQATTLIAGGGGLALLGFAAMSKMSGGIVSTIGTMQELGMISEATGTRVQKGMGKGIKSIGKFALAAGAAKLAIQLLGNAMGDLGEGTDVGELSEAVLKTADAVRAADEAMVSINSNQFLDSAFIQSGSEGWTGFAKGISKVWNAVQWGDDVDWSKPVDGIQGLADAAESLASGDNIPGWAKAANDFLGLMPIEADAARESFNNLDSSLAALVDAGRIDEAAIGFKEAEQALLAVGMSTEEVAALFDDYSLSLEENKRAQDEAANAADAYANSEEGKAEALKETTDALKEQLEAQRELTDANMGAADAEVGYQQSLVDSKKRLGELRGDLKKNVKELDLTTQAGRDAQDSLLRFAESGLRTVDAMNESGAAGEDVRKKMGGVRKSFIDMAQQAGLTKDAAKALADAWGLQPDSVVTTVEIEDQASKKLDDIREEIVTLPDGRTITINVKYNESQIAGPGRTAVTAKATGGAVYGPGTGTSDDIPALLSNGEHVLTADDVKKMGGQQAVYRMRSQVQSGMLRFASGGMVSLSGGTGHVGDPVADAKARVARERRQVKSAEKALDRAQNASTRASRASADTSSKDKAAKARAKKAARDAADAVKAARKELSKQKAQLKAAEKELSDSRKERSQEKERRSDIRDLRAEHNTDARRGTTQDQVSSGLSGGLAAVDSMLRLANSGTLSKEKSSTLKSVAKQAEKDLTKQYAILEKTNAKISEQAELLSSVKGLRDQISQSMMGEVRLADVLSQKDAFGYDVATTPKSIQDYLNTKLAKAKAFNGKLDALRKKGAPNAILREVLNGGVEGGTALADALLSSSGAEWSSITSTWGALEAEAGRTGDIATMSEFGTTSDVVEKNLAASVAAAESTLNEIKSIGALLSSVTGVALQGYASGGWVTGGVRGRDSVPIMSMPDEFVVRAGPARENANLLERINAGFKPQFVSPDGIAGASGASSYANIQGTAPATAGGVSLAALVDALRGVKFEIRNSFGVDRRTASEVVVAGLTEARSRDRATLSALGVG